jgi:hypothetical protein
MTDNHDKFVNKCDKIIKDFLGITRRRWTFIGRTIAPKGNIVIGDEIRYELWVLDIDNEKLKPYDGNIFNVTNNVWKKPDLSDKNHPWNKRRELCNHKSVLKSIEIKSSLNLEG